MGDIITCIGLRYGLIPVAFVSFLITAYFFFRYRTEPDLIHRDIVADRMKYAAIITALFIVAVPLIDYVFSSNLLDTGCARGIILPGQETCRVSNEFANGTSRSIFFPVRGGSNTETKINLPRNAKIRNASFIIDYSENKTWIDEFENWSRISDSSAIDVDGNKGYAYIKVKKLLVDSTQVLDGTHSYDEVYIKSGGILTTSVGESLELKINGPLTIESGGAIDLAGKGNVNFNKEKPKKNPNSGTPTWASGGGGGGHGGEGGRGGDDEKLRGGAADPIYGSTEDPTELGAVGGYGGGAEELAGSGRPSVGGLGGGALKVTAKKIVVNGYISADGGDGIDATLNEGTGGGGGGSGGSILLTADDITVNGKITADGGNGGSDYGNDAGGGGGGGGRIAVYYKMVNGENNIFANGGKAGKAPKGKEGVDGSKGTIYMKSIGEDVKNDLIMAQLTSLEIKPDNLGCWQKFTARSVNASGSEIRFSVLNSSNNKSLCDINADRASKGYDISGCTQCAQGVRLRAEMVTISIEKTPMLLDWRIQYGVELKNFTMDIGRDGSREYNVSSFSGTTMLTDENTQPKISAEISRFVSGCGCQGCALTAANCTIDIEFQAQCSGILRIRNASLEYCQTG